MADGTFAALLFIIGLTDMGINHCGTSEGCLATGETRSRLSISGGEVLERRADPAAELYLRYDLAQTRGPFGGAAGLSVTENGEAWVGFGATYLVPFGRSGPYAELHAMPGLYFHQGQFDLGPPHAFRSRPALG